MLLFSVAGRDVGLRRKAERAIRLFTDLRNEMEQIGKFVIREAKANLKARHSRVSRGRLAQSLQATPYKMSVTISSVLPYARIQQEGGVVRPKKRKMLAIPLQEDLARNHVWPKHVKPEQIVRIGKILWFIRKRKVRSKPPKWIAGMVSKIMKSVAGSKGKGKGGKKQKGGSQSIRDRAVPGWVLVRSATIPGRPYIVKSRSLIQYMRKLFAKKLDDYERSVRTTG